MKSAIVKSSSLRSGSWHKIWEVERITVELEQKRKWLKRAAAMVTAVELKLEQAKQRREDITHVHDTDQKS